MNINRQRLSSQHNAKYHQKLASIYLIRAKMADKCKTFYVKACPIDTPEAYEKYVGHVIRLISASMYCTEEALSRQSLYYLLTRDGGYKKKGYYETQLPHLIHVVSEQFQSIDGKLTFRSQNKDDPPALCISPSHGMLSGLYTCSLSLSLSNPHWRLEYAKSIDQGKSWNLDAVFKHIPHGSPTKCNAQLTLTLLHYTAPLPQKTEPSFFHSINQKMQEFKQIFNVK
jgi:hypothetical protein